MRVELLRWNQIRAIVGSHCISVGLRPLTCQVRLQLIVRAAGSDAANGVQRKGCLYLILCVDISGRVISDSHQLSLHKNLIATIVRSWPTADLI